MTPEPYVLYIEDERPLMELVRHILKMSGYKVIGLSSGQKGLELMREQKPSVLLLDLMMPTLSGWDIYREMKSDTSLADIPVIVITARILERGRILIKGLPPVDDYVTKPFEVDHLLRAVKTFIEKR